MQYTFVLRALSCVHGDEVLPMVGRLRPDIPVLDIEMPEVNGLEIAEQLKEYPLLRPKKMVALTGYGDAVMRAMIAAAGFDHHLVKPVGWPELSAVLP
jgi:CheY-like chemotaxis protein